jgi:hypothetical protein
MTSVSSTGFRRRPFEAKLHLRYTIGQWEWLCQADFGWNPMALGRIQLLKGCNIPVGGGSPDGFGGNADKLRSASASTAAL